jgi:hypothetical protein
MYALDLCFLSLVSSVVEFVPPYLKLEKADDDEN